MSGSPTRDVEVGGWHDAVAGLREEGFDFFDWLSAVDQSDADPAGLDLVCHLLDSTARPLRATMLRTRVPLGAPAASLTDLYAGAAWHERETHEMFGIEFAGFDDGTGLGCRPLLLPDGFEGTPLRKSFVLVSRAAKAWPGAKEPGEGGGESGEPRTGGSPGRRKLLPPGVPDAGWGPASRR